ncbi:unnamed protein product [Litomosoides sigmodontis]|uniref:Uncharacterized protein n=1 Tax=Litomosoides sigmodontis TaxID=42156 RepID=A0A3P6TP17_LITSI|nr:unnamed protein product [Litomosoides sigmodontis]
MIYVEKKKIFYRLNEPLEVLRDRRAKEISPPSYMKRFEYELNEQLLQQIWSNVLQRKMLRQRRLLQSLFYLPRGRER